MKKILLMLAVLLLTISCEKEGEIELSKSDVVGKWEVTKATEDGETIELPSGAIVVKLTNDGKYSVNFLGDYYTGTYTVVGNKVTGISGSITEYFEFTSFSGNKAKIDYMNTTGDRYKFEVVRK